jgi:uncharacterized membrane protein YdbT with pleckstrin-like domain
MPSRERKRADRQKRKQRSAERREETARKREQVTARREARNQAAREALEPLEEGERPTVVTIGAVVSALIALSAIVGYVAGVEVTKVGSDGIEQGEDEAPLLSIVAVVGLMGTMAYGMWKARYWAVLGFQALLVIVLVAASLGLIQATEWPQAVGTTLLIAGAGALFYFMVKAMARIQMPERQ